jgi:putative peptide zinc metalloprotease protein
MMKNYDINQKDSFSFDLKLIPRLINIQRITKFHTSYSKPSYIISSAVGRNFRITVPMYKILRLVDGEHSLEDLTYVIKEQEDLDISPETLWELFENELIPRSLITFEDKNFDTTEEKFKSNSRPFSLRIFPRKAQLLLSHFFSKITSLQLLIALIGLYFVLTLTINEPRTTNSIGQLDSLIILLLILLGILIHELGHSSAAVRGKIQPGPIGIRFLMIFPVFFIDVNNGWILDRKSRIELDLGGIGLQSGFGILLLLFSNLLQSPLLFIASSVTFSIVLLNIIPFPRFDGYWFLTDVLGVPNLKDTALSMLWRTFSKKEYENKPWGSVPTSIQFILFCYGLFTVFSIFLVIFYFSQFVMVVLTLITNFPDFMDQIEIFIFEGRFPDFLQMIRTIFSLIIFISFILMIIKTMRYIKSKIVTKVD